MTPATACRSCGSRDLSPFLDLGEQPLANALVAADRTGALEPRYPLAVALCHDCSLVQITETVDPEIMFRDYVYFSSVSETMLTHARQLADRITGERHLDTRSLVVEIASNDGYLLKNFVRSGIPVLGIEPARNIARSANDQGIPTVAEFFNTALATELATAGKRADAIVANNVMAHVPEINDVARGIKVLLNDHGVFMMETPYVKDLIDRLEFDTIYHEHCFYYSLTALERLFRRHDLAVIDVQRVPIHGGSVQVTVTHAGNEERRRSVETMLSDEEHWARDMAYYGHMAERVASLKREVVGLLRRLRAEGQRIAAYGAAAKGATLLNYMGIGTDLVEYVVDRSPHKQGKLMPGARIPIRPPGLLLEDRPDHVLLLAWNLADEVLAQQSAYRASGGRFIIPAPSVRIV